MTEFVDTIVFVLGMMGAGAAIWINKMKADKEWNNLWDEVYKKEEKDETH